MVQEAEGPLLRRTVDLSEAETKTDLVPVDPVMRCSLTTAGSPGQVPDRKDICSCSVAQSCPTLCNPMDFSLLGPSIHGDSSRNNTGVGCQPSYKGSSQPMDWTQISRIAGGFFTVWATWEAHITYILLSAKGVKKVNCRDKEGSLQGLLTK